MDLYCKGLLVYFTINEGKKATIKDHLRGGHFNFRKYYQNFVFSLCWIVHNKIMYIYYELHIVFKGTFSTTNIYSYIYKHNFLQIV